MVDPTFRFSRPACQATLAPSTRLVELGLGGARLALGLAGLGGAWGAVDEGEARETLRAALAAGVTVFDVAPAYGRGEELLGAALATWRGQRPIISTKVGRIAASGALELAFDFSPAGMRTSVERSLAALGVERIDLLFLHEPDHVPREERPRVAATLRQLRADGLARRIGLAGGDGAAWDGLLEGEGVDVVMLFRRLDACVLDGAREEVPRLRRAGVATYGASPLHMGLLGGRFEEFIQERPHWVWPAALARAERLKVLAEATGLALPTLAHRFAFSLAGLDRVVIGARNVRELQAALTDFAAGPLPEDLFQRVVAATG
ncbi:aldo/keto reductase [Horticoccus luteus]|uniref:Aldo/keto reductase n=1 Tax=Horticoccus luteus TaxID=2862869 RepID=A0A8F9TWE5_9BACT|nr:aldo/keto reductase [Horticoccus luteus]QYM78993.1 aldo/keto reductase [Horticoccus luteus]